MSLKSATVKEPNRVELEVEIDADSFEQAVQQTYRKQIMKMNVPGFRKGHAPRHLVEKMYGADFFYEDALQELYPEALQEAIDASDYEYVEDKIDMDVVSVGKEGAVFKAVITVKPEVEIEGYKGLKAPKDAEPVTEGDVEHELGHLAEHQARLVSVEDRAAKDGDIVSIDFEGTVDGVPFEGGKAEKHSLTLGSGQFIPGFEEQVAGQNLDEEFEVKVTFPDDYQEEKLAGKDAVFHCRLHGIQVKELPEMNDEFAKDASDFDTLDELKADLRTKLEEQRQKTADDKFESTLADALVERLQGDIPQAMIDNRVKENVRDMEYRLRQQGLTVELYKQYTGMDDEAFLNGFRAGAEKSVKARLALEKIAKTEGLTASDEEVEAQFAKLAEQYKMPLEQVKAAIDKDELAKDLAVEKAMNLVKETADTDK
ncbi:MAG: trigger factor [Oscillospiraceae bacterium]|nr:trigger factor [Oscillospiraceae bacterium]